MLIKTPTVPIPSAKTIATPSRGRGRIGPRTRCHLRFLILVIGSSILAMSAYAGAPQAFTTKTTALYRKANAKRILGAITPGTAVMISDQSRAGKGRKKISLEGWSAKGDETDVYQAPDLRILLAHLTSAGLSGRKVLAQQKDPYGIVWQRITLVGWARKRNLTSNLSRVWTAARKLYETRCTACHALHRPTEFTANEWPNILRTMGKNAAFNPEQLALVTKYLQTHARK